MSNKNLPNHEQQTSRSRTSSEVLEILAPSHEDPQPIRRAGIWKTAPEAEASGRSER